MKQLIPQEELKRSRKRCCHYCDTWVSVKWKIPTEELDRVYYGVTGNVYCCSKCADRHYVGSKD